MAASTKDFIARMLGESAPTRLPSVSSGGGNRYMDLAQRVVGDYAQQRPRSGDSGGSSGQVSPSGQLVDWQGRRFDAGVLPRFQGLYEAVPGLRVTSGWRDPERNAAVGGAARSHHLSGRAGDFVGSREQMEAALAWARANAAIEAMIHDAGSGTHLHVAW